MLVAIRTLNRDIPARLIHWDEIERIPRRGEWLHYEGTSYEVKQIVTRVDRIFDEEDTSRYTHVMLLLEELK